MIKRQVHLGKRTPIRAYAKRNVKLSSNHRIREGDRLKAYGHWDVEDGVYCGLISINEKIVRKRADVVLKFDDFTLYVLVEWVPNKPRRRLRNEDLHTNQE